MQEEVTSVNRFNSLPLRSVCGHCHGYMLVFCCLLANCREALAQKRMILNC